MTPSGGERITDGDAFADLSRVRLRVGLLNRGQADELHRVLWDLGSRPRSVVEVDVSDLDHTDERSLFAVLVKVHRRMQESTSSLIVINPSPRMARYLSATQVSFVKGGQAPTTKPCDVRLDFGVTQTRACLAGDLGGQPNGLCAFGAQCTMTNHVGPTPMAGATSVVRRSLVKFPNLNARSTRVAR